MKFSSSPRLWCSCSFFFLRTYNETNLFKNPALRSASSCQKTQPQLSVVFRMHARALTFSESGPVFSSSNFGIKNSLTLSDGGRWSSLYDDRYHSDDSFWNTLLLCGVVRLSRMRFVSFLKRFFSRVASRKLITVGVIFFLFPLVFNFTQKTSQFADTLCARKSKRRRKKRPITKVLYSRSLIKHKTRR